MRDRQAVFLLPVGDSPFPNSKSAQSLPTSGGKSDTSCKQQFKLFPPPISSLSPGHVEVGVDRSAVPVVHSGLALFLRGRLLA